MKKLLLAISILLMLTLTACGASSTATPVPVTASDPAAGTLPATSQLVIGTLKLDGTANAVTAAQAAELLPLWQVYQSLSASDTAAPAEVDALLQQIQSTMTADQTKAIIDMQLTQQDVFTFMQEQGLSLGGGQSNSGTSQNGTSQSGGQQNGGGFAPPDGGMPGGMPGGGPGQGTGGQSLSPDQIATAQAARAQSGGNLNRIPTPLVEALIQYLKEKAGS